MSESLEPAAQWIGRGRVKVRGQNLSPRKTHCADLESESCDFPIESINYHRVRPKNVHRLGLEFPQWSDSPRGHRGWTLTSKTVFKRFFENFVEASRTTHQGSSFGALHVLEDMFIPRDRVRVHLRNHPRNLTRCPRNDENDKTRTRTRAIHCAVTIT